MPEAAQSADDADRRLSASVRRDRITTYAISGSAISASSSSGGCDTPDDMSGGVAEGATTGQAIGATTLKRARRIQDACATPRHQLQPR